MNLLHWLLGTATGPQDLPSSRPVLERYHLTDAQPRAAYPLSEGDILRLLHIARSGNYVTHNSIQLRLEQAMLPDEQESDPDFCRCTLDDLYSNWCRSGTYPTPALARCLYSLTQRTTTKPAILAEWDRHGADGYSIDPIVGWITFDDCPICQAQGMSTCTGHCYCQQDANEVEEDAF